MDTFSANIQALRKSQPALADAVEAAPSILAHAVKAPDGGLSVRTGGSEGAWIHSRRAPLAECERLVEGLTLKPMQPCLFLGVGNGHALKLMLGRFKECQALVIEPNLSLVRLVLETLDLSAEIKAGRVILAAEVTGHQYRAAFDRIGEVIALFQYQQVTHLYAAQDTACLAAYSEFATWAQVRSLSLRSELIGARTTIENLMYNLPHYLTAAPASSLKGILKGVPAILAGAGPSLQRNISVLKAKAPNAFILAVSSALKRVAGEGIPVHATNVVDYSHLSQRYFTSLPGVAPPLWVDPRTNPRVLDVYEGRKVMYDDDFYRGIFLDRVAPLGSLRAEGNNVSHIAFLILRHLGCDPIILCGMDQSYSFHITHIPGTAIHDEWAASSHRFNTLETQELAAAVALSEPSHERTDVYGNPLLTDNLMESSAVVLENLIASATDATVINATEGGRPLRGAANMTLAEAFERHANRPVDLSAYFGGLAEDHTGGSANLARGISVFEDVRRHNVAVRESFREAKRLLNRAEKTLLKREMPDNADHLLDGINIMINKWRGVYSGISSYATADSMARARLESVIRDDSMDEIERSRILVRRERDYIKALEIAMDMWDDLCSRSLERMRTFKELAHA